MLYVTAYSVLLTRPTNEKRDIDGRTVDVLPDAFSTFPPRYAIPCGPAAVTIFIVDIFNALDAEQARDALDALAHDVIAASVCPSDAQVRR